MRLPSAAIGERLHAALLSCIVAAAAALVLFVIATQSAHRVDAVAIAILVAASAFDAISGTMPLLLLLAAVAFAGGGAVIDGRIPWLVLFVLPFGYAALRTREAAIGWGDVLALAVIVIALPIPLAIGAIVIASALSLSISRLRRQSAERMTPYLAAAAAVALWFVR